MHMPLPLRSFRARAFSPPCRDAGIDGKAKQHWESDPGQSLLKTALNIYLFGRCREGYGNMMACPAPAMPGKGGCGKKLWIRRIQPCSSYCRSGNVSQNVAFPNGPISTPASRASRNLMISSSVSSAARSFCNCMPSTGKVSGFMSRL